MTEDTNSEVIQNEAKEDQTTQPGLISRILRVLFRVFVAVLVGLAIGLGIYFGALRIYRDAIEPIQNYEARIGELEQSLARLDDDLQNDTNALNDRQAEIEGKLVEQGEAIASVEALIAAAQQDLREQRRVLASVDELQQESTDLSVMITDLLTRVDQIEAEIDSGDLPALKVQRTAVYLRAMTLLTRAQLELDRNNLGFAEEQVVFARDALQGLLPPEPVAGEPYGDGEILIDIIARLEGIIADLPGRPNTAGDDLETVWGLFLQALQPVQSVEIEAGGE
jgi:hypothetical protein